MIPGGVAISPVLAAAAISATAAAATAVAFGGFDAARVVGVALAVDPEPAHVVGTGGAIGAALRHWVYLRISREGIPAATLTVNAIGSFVLGIAIFAGVGASALRLVGIGACGSFTTFSTFSVETVRLWERGDRRLAVVNAGVNLLASLAAVGLAWLVATVVPS